MKKESTKSVAERKRMMQFTVKDFLASVRETYEEMQQLHEEAKGEKVRYPDFEAALEHFETHGLADRKHSNGVWVNMLVDGIREKVDLVRHRLSYSEVIGVLELVKYEVLKEAEAEAQ